MNSRAYRPAILSPAVPVVSVHGSSVAGGPWGQQTGHSDLYSWTRLTSSTGRPQVVVSAPSAQLCILKSGLCVSALERHGRTMMVPPALTTCVEFYTKSGSEGKRFSRCAAAAACRRFDTPNFVRMCETWTLTVLSVMNSRLAICWFE
jgi:hypothetical protein